MSDKAAGTHLVQLGSYDSKLEAERGWTMLQGKFASLKGHKPVYTQAVVNAFREDEVRPSLPRERALANGPDQNDEAFVVPRVIG